MAKQNGLQLLLDRTVQKRYRAAVYGRMEGSGEIDEPISGKPAVTRWAAVAYLPAHVMATAQAAPDAAAAAAALAASSGATCGGVFCDGDAATNGSAICGRAEGRQGGGQAAPAVAGGSGDAARHGRSQHAGQAVTILDLWPHTGA